MFWGCCIDSKELSSNQTLNLAELILKSVPCLGTTRSSHLSRPSQEKDPQHPVTNLTPGSAQVSTSRSLDWPGHTHPARGLAGRPFGSRGPPQDQGCQNGETSWVNISICQFQDVGAL